MRSSPSDPPERATAGATEFLSAQPFAHRGLHGAGRVENSRAAFDAAIAQGHGIELDVRASLDGEAFVFHDATLERLCGRSEALADLPAKAIDGILLSGTGETIPSLHAVLARVLGKVPVLIEVKADEGQVAPLCLSVRRSLEGYRGPVAVMSFNPEVGHWFAEHSPRTPRGLVVSERDRKDRRGAIERRLSLWRSKAQFLAYDVRDLPSRFAERQRARGLPVLTWTVRDAAAERIGFAHADEIIYEKP